jgi:hypothetical protein
MQKNARKSTLYNIWDKIFTRRGAEEQKNNTPRREAAGTYTEYSRTPWKSARKDNT